MQYSKRQVRIPTDRWSGTRPPRYHPLPTGSDKYCEECNREYREPTPYPSLYGGSNFHPSKYKSDITTITRQDLTNPFTNMSVAIIYYRSVLSTYANNNPIAAIEVYNKGPGNFNTNIKAATNNTGLSRDQLLNNIENPIYLDYSYACNAGDPKYVPNVLQYLNGDMIISFVDENNNITEVKCVINKTKKEELVR